MFSTSFLKLGLALLPIVAAKVIDIRVGDGGLKYSPEAIGAAVGDQVVFHFIAKNHTVTQSSFADPCGRAEGGFDSGFMPVTEGYAPPTFTVDVKDTKPIWVYCRQAGKTANSHCGAGMVFAINCGLDHEPNSFGNFKKAALAVGEKLKAEAAASATPSSGGGYGGGGYGGGADSAATPTAAETAPYGGYTLPPVAGPVVVVTKEVTLGDAKWTTTYSSYPGSADPTPAAAEGVNHKVIVGGASGLIFDPPRVDAKPRDTVTFEFRQKNHTVTQSSFSDPCRKLENGFDTGFFPVAADFTGEFPTWTVTVNDTQPIWAYCKQRTPASHCGAGMVFAINSVESSQRNFAAFQNVAKAINGTAAAQESAPAPTSTGAATNNNAGVASFPMTGAALTIVFGALFSLL